MFIIQFFRSVFVKCLPFYPLSWSKELKISLALKLCLKGLKRLANLLRIPYQMHPHPCFYFVASRYERPSENSLHCTCYLGEDCKNLYRVIFVIIL